MSSDRHLQHRPALIALSLGGFGIGLTEFVIAGLLSEIAKDFDVPITHVGRLVGVYALAVVPGALIVTPALLSRRPKHALMLLLGLFIAGNVLSAWAPNYWTMFAGRVVAALAHGGYFGIGSVVAGSLVPESRKASAVASLFAGLTVANVLGVPLGTVVGQHLGWRAVFWVISAIGVLALGGLITQVPDTDPEPDQLPIGAQFRVLGRRQVLGSLAVTALVFGGMFGTFIYIEPLLRQLSGYSAAAIPWLLVLFGAGLFVGNLAGGRAADHNPDRAVLVLAVVLPVVIATLAAVAAWRIPAAAVLALMGAVGFATVPGLQARVLRDAEGAKTLASAGNIAAFNVGNTIGVALAGLALDRGFGLRSPAMTGAGLTLAGWLLFLLVRHTSTPHTPTERPEQ